MESKLTAKQKMFCQEYMIDLNATQAAIRAGYSEDTAKEIGCQNLTKVNIQEYLQKLMKERMERVLITQEDVLKDIIETRTATAQEGKHSDRLRANELLGKHLAMFVDRTDNTNRNHALDNIDFEKLKDE
jgi:phage terminase small subunit